MARQSEYKPPPSIGHEMGVMFGFIVFMLVCSLIYGVVWQNGNKGSQLKETARIEKLRASGLLRRDADG
ncbi:hypothetical protein K458DRAFT_391940 [Lentithecium fluviatile CBS 122367]|uniref:Uncharacterized protein n=1 Tax=Lentithecium fluviatile CBS 122367 TaxID=1168545 RepID=A0A6G1ITY1_9PLEO|nr:hypothetical protein K458DRAFT_391940 [Lentithecium fluviatile CBS 122367]